MAATSSARLVAGSGGSVAPVLPSLRTYAWGSREAIARLQGRPHPTDEPEAELWFGAHPRGPATLARGGGPVRLDAAIVADAAGELGARVVADHGPRLPFLVKVLAAAVPLSIQTHPDDERARAGCAAEDARGVPRDDPARGFPDPHGKPETLVAVTPMRARAGLRRPEDAAATLAALAPVGSAALVRALLTDDGVGRDGPTGRTLTALLALAPADRVALVRELVGGARAHADEASELGREARTVLALDAEFPDDVGVAVALLLAHVELAPGDALHVRPGTLHAHLEGVGVEVMGAADGVLRAGLTHKPVDPEGLLALADLVPSEPDVLRDVAALGGQLPARAREFALEVRDVDRPGSETLDRRAGGPALVLAVDGDLEVAADADRVVLAPTGAAWVAARAGDMRVTGSGRVVVVSVPTTR